LGPKKDQVTGEWRRPHNGELYDLANQILAYSNDQIKKNEMDWACGTFEKGEVLQLLGGET